MGNWKLQYRVPKKWFLPSGSPLGEDSEQAFMTQCGQCLFPEKPRGEAPRPSSSSWFLEELGPEVGLQNNGSLSGQQRGCPHHCPASNLALFSNVAYMTSHIHDSAPTSIPKLISPHALLPTWSTATSIACGHRHSQTAFCFWLYTPVCLKYSTRSEGNWILFIL